MIMNDDQHSINAQLFAQWLNGSPADPEHEKEQSEEEAKAEAATAGAETTETAGTAGTVAALDTIPEPGAYPQVKDGGEVLTLPHHKTSARELFAEFMNEQLF